MDPTRLNFLFEKLTQEEWFVNAPRPTSTIVEVNHVPVDADAHSVPVVPHSPTGMDSIVPSADPYDAENPPQEVIDYVLSMRPSECTATERLIRKRAMNRKAASVSRKRKRVQVAGIKTKAEQLAQRTSQLEQALRETLLANQRMAAQLSAVRQAVQNSPALAEIVERLGGQEAMMVAQTPAEPQWGADTGSESGDWLDDADLDFPPAKRFCP
jgi:hypothetical protein